MTNLPIFRRFKDLKERNIVKDHRDLEKKIRELNFPPGRMAGPRTRVWTDEEIADWYQSLPTAVEAKPELRGYARKSHEAKRAREAMRGEAS
jgi:hypothetical protein